MHAHAGVYREAGLLDEATVADGETDPGDHVRNRCIGTDRMAEGRRQRRDERNRHRRAQYSCGARVDLRVVGVGTTAMPLAGRGS